MIMLTEREIENKLKDVIADLYKDSAIVPVIVGVWDVADDGEIKGQGDASVAAIAIAVGIRSYASFCEPQADIPCTIALTVRRDACPTGAEFSGMIEPLMGKINLWNADYDDVIGELNTDTFDIGGFQMTGGGTTQNETAWTARISFTLRGVINVLQNQHLIKENKNVI